MKRAQEEISKIVEQLKALIPRVRPRTAFGDDNRQAIDIQVFIIESDMSEDEIWDRWEDNDRLRDMALEARSWLDGEEIEGGLVEGWESLVQD